MRAYPHRCGLILVFAFAVWGNARSAAPPPRPGLDELLLMKLGLATDTPSLLRRLREHTPDAKDLARLKDLIRDLGDDSFRVRGDASARLEKLGAAALDELTRAVDHPDPEIRGRVRRCVRNI